MKFISSIKGFFNTLIGRIVLGGLSINLVLMPVLLIGVVTLVKKGFEANFIDRVRLDSHIFAESVAQAQNPGLIREMLDDVMMSERYVYADLVVEGETQENKWTRRSDRKFQEDSFVGQHGDDIYYLSVQLPSNKDFDSTYTLRLGYDETSIVEHIHNTIRLCAYLVIAYLLMMLLASGIFGPLISRPLRSLRADARKIASGGYDHQLNVNTSISEISSLAGDFETMRRELVRHNKELEYQSLHDSLTNLPNRLLLHDRLRQAIYTAQREDHKMALLMIDLDGFKAINDTLGHHYGDLLLQQLSSRIQGALRKSDTIARFGGDEFCILLPVITDCKHATDIAGKLLETLEQPFIFEGRPYNVDMSIGIALYPEHGCDSSVLMRHADVAMYIAKNNSLDYTLYDSSQDKNSISRLSLMWDLRRTIENGDLDLVYQPIINISDGTLSAVESLVRWNHPQRGTIMPDDFITLSEQANLIKPLTAWVLTEAVRQCRSWQRQGHDFKVSVNLSPRSLHDHEHPRHLMQIIRNFGISAESLILELTESAIISDPKGAQEILEEFNAMGMALAVDDFGTGYSSLSSLKKLPLDIIKIDRSFILEMLDNKDDLTIVRSTIELARNMGLQVVAEGVVSLEILQQLKELGCDMAQGYHICKPLGVAKLECWLNDSGQQASA